MKILIIHNAYQSRHVGGEDIIVQQEIKALKKRLGEGQFFEYIVYNDHIKLWQLAFSVWGNRKHAQQIYQLVKKNNIKVVHVHNFFPLLTLLIFKSAKAAGATVIQTLHNFRWWCLAGTLYQKKGICGKCTTKKFSYPAIFNRCYRQSYWQSIAGSLAFAWYKFKKYQQFIDAYWVLSQFQLEKIKNLSTINNIILKPNSIEPPQHYFPIDEKKDYIFVGRLEKAKGFELLLNIWKRLPLDYQLWVIGTDTLEWQKKYQLDNVHFLGKRPHPEVIEKIARAKYLLQPTLAYETFGLTILEALAHGTPVIAIGGGPRDELIENGKNGFLCGPETLYDTIHEAHYYASYAALSQAAIQSARPYYSSLVIEQQIKLYAQLMAK